MQIERLAFVAFPVSDLERSRAFYVQIFGASEREFGRDWSDLNLGGLTIRIYVHQGDYDRQHSGLQFVVSDIDDVFSELRSAGIDLRSNIRTELWGGRVFTVADPDGNLFDLLDSTTVAAIAPAATASR